VKGRKEGRQISVSGGRGCGCNIHPAARRRQIRLQEAAARMRMCRRSAREAVGRAGRMPCAYAFVQRYVKERVAGTLPTGGRKEVREGGPGERQVGRMACLSHEAGCSRQGETKARHASGRWHSSRQEGSGHGVQAAVGAVVVAGAVAGVVACRVWQVRGGKGGGGGGGVWRVGKQRCGEVGPRAARVVQCLR